MKSQVKELQSMGQYEKEFRWIYETFIKTRQKTVRAASGSGEVSKRHSDDHLAQIL